VIAADGKAAAEAIAAGRTPLEHLLSVMNDPLADPVRRDEWARAAAPFVHPKLGTVEVRHLPSSMGRLPSPNRDHPCRSAIRPVVALPAHRPGGLREMEIKTVDGTETGGKSKPE